MQPADADKRRRDLYAVSLGILLFNIAGGKLAGSGDPFVAGITIERTYWLYVFAALSLAYFYWRFLLVSDGARTRLLDDIDKEIRRSPRFAAYVHRRMHRAMTRLPNGRAAHQSIPGLLRSSIVFQFKDRSLLSEVYDEVGIMYPQAAVAFPDALLAAMRSEKDFEPWSQAERWRIVVSAAWRAVWRQHTFTDYWLPNFTALAAAASALIRYAHHFAH